MLIALKVGQKRKLLLLEVRNQSVELASHAK